MSAGKSNLGNGGLPGGADNAFPDHTRQSQRGGFGDDTPSPEAIERGFTKVSVERTHWYDEDAAGGGGEQVGNPMTYGGFLGRPNGYAR